MRPLAWTLLIALLLAASLAATLASFGLPVGDSLRLLIEGCAGDRFGISRTLVKASPLLLVALGMAAAWRSGIYNIGGEGQFIIGGLAAASAYKVLGGLPGPLLTVVLATASMIGGAGFAWIAAWLQVTRGVQAVISTIMLNFVAIQLLGWMVGGPIQESAHRLPQTDKLPQSAMFWRFDRQMDLHIGMLLAVVAAGFLWIYLFRTGGGFQTRLVGSNPNAARAARIDVGRVQLRAMAISGGLCGLAAATEYLGLSGMVDKGFSQQWGFLGIPVALAGGLNPIGIAASSLYFGALFAGSDNLARYTPSGAPIVVVVQAVAVFALLAAYSLRSRLEAGREAA